MAQLERIGELIEKKIWIGKNYNERLKNIPGLILPVEEIWAKNVYWMYGIVLDETIRINAKRLASRLNKLGVDTRPFLLGMHEQPIFKKMGLVKDESYPISEMISRRGLYLPSGLTLTEKDISFVVDAVKKAL
ncbi:GDP-perosamine synthase [subsurface metagenome]